jgi:hypothetical protein
MSRSLIFIILLSLTSDCIEPYNFRIKNNNPTLVIEAHISNVSFEDAKNYPSDGRYFSTKLAYTSDVINIHDAPVSDAAVILYDDLDNSWLYDESPTGSGYYYLYDGHFKVDVNRSYKLQIHLSNGSIYESDFEKTNNTFAPEMGAIDFKETTKLTYEIEIGEKVINAKNGIDVGISIPINEQKKTLYYRWDFEPTWIFTAPFGSIARPDYHCWVSSKYYIKDYALLEDNVGGFRKGLFFMETTRNDRIYEEISILITQYSMTEAYYNFWNEMMEQSQKGGLFDAPPYNLSTNFHCVNCDSKVSGYFGVVEEQATRWYFKKSDLSYQVENTLRADCSVPFQDPGPECFSCLAYPFGNSINVKPEWWR